MCGGTQPGSVLTIHGAAYLALPVVRAKRKQGPASSLPSTEREVGN